MRPSEIILLAFDLLLILFLLFRPNPSKLMLSVIGGAAILILIFNIAVDGYRWQMIPAYILTIFLLSLSLLRLKKSEQKHVVGWLKVFIGFLGILTLLIAVLLPIVLPVPTLDEPSGKYSVGTSTYHIVDEDRIDFYNETPNARRELMVQLWYPAESGEESIKAKYIEQLDRAAPIIARRLGLPAFLLQHLTLIRTNSFKDAQIAPNEAGYPLILFSHGLAGLRMQNTALFEHLASHGYVIASVDHTFDSVFTVFPDGRVTIHRQEVIFPEETTFLEAGHQLMVVRTNDLDAVLNYLKDLNQINGNSVAGAINFDEVGVAGHSTGGGTALLFCLESPSCLAMLALDGWLEPLAEELNHKKLAKPAMFMNTPEWLQKENQRLGRNIIMEQQDIAYELTITGMGHNNFTDIPLLSPLTTPLGLTGSINSNTGLNIVNDYSLAFFDKHLRDEKQPLLQNDHSPPPEVQFKTN
jgi:dienelactone hydrolase